MADATPAGAPGAPATAPRPRRILLVEDEEGLVLALEDSLASEGYLVSTASDGIVGQREASTGGYDLIVLDVMLPGRDGFQVCQNLRSAGCRSRILMLTARGTTIDTVMGLRLGADDYLAKPFDMQVLLARVHALLRRMGGDANPGPEAPVVYRFGPFRLDGEAFELRRGEETIPLNAQELKLLLVLARNPNRVLSREMLLNEAWGYDADTTTRTVDVHIAWLRRKLGEQERPRHLLTVRGLGYKFMPEAARPGPSLEV
jgi:DNA-binding response OmpR family regulator